jgi:hypothetical protein
MPVVRILLLLRPLTIKTLMKVKPALPFIPVALVAVLLNW